jgi:aerobic carbon-monoxide dehydrogenase medium subunit
MFPASFEYHRASSVKDALALLTQFGDDAKILSGGHSLLPMMKLRLAQPAHIVDIGAVRELAQIKEEGGHIVIGGLATHHAVETSPIVRAKTPILSECAALIGDIQVRNRGTIGGSLAHADPAADYPAAALALEAEMTLENSAGSRTVKAEDFFLDLLTTAVKPGEILTQVSVAPLAPGTGAIYLKHRHPASGFATVGVAVIVTLKGANFDKVRVGITGLGAKAFRASNVEKALAGRAVDGIAEAASHAPDGVDATSDTYASGEFRAELARVYTRRALEQAAARAKA